METLLSWKKDTKRRPLVLQGARQTGKTWLLREFGRRYYPRQLYFHLGTDTVIRTYFEQEADPVCLLEFLEAYGKVPIHPSATLVILDDIQECPAARKTLAAFAAELPGYSIVAAERTPGPYQPPKLLPADAQTEILQTMDFEEFLWACREVSLAKEIREHYKSKTPMEREAHQKSMRLFSSYLVVGGLPASVLAYREGHSFLGVTDVLSKIQHMDLEDITLCQKKENQSVTRACYRSLPAQLQKENDCFQYRLAREGSTRGIMDGGIQWLTEQGMAVIVKEAEGSGRRFKLYSRDVGLCTMNMGLPIASLLLMETSISIRHLIENCMAVEFHNKGYNLSYWASGNKAALPFLLESQGEVLAVDHHYEKSRKSRSLFEYQKTHDTKAFRISNASFCETDRFYEIPYYAFFCI